MRCYGSGVTYGVRQHPDRIEVRQGDEVVAVLRWFQPRLHFHPRILLLAFEDFEALAVADLGPVIEEVCRILRAGVDAGGALLLRVTLDERSVLLPFLKRSGFLETRRVYEPVLPLDGPIPEFGERLATIAGRPVRVLGLSEARARVGEEALVRLFWEVYGRVARLDAATPERLTEQERTSLVVGDEDLEWRATTCAFFGERLVGLCSVYRGEAREELELGPFGVAEASLAHHEEVTLAMLRASIVRAMELGASRLRAEIDSDDSRTLLTCAALPFRTDRVAVSLVFAPRWEGLAELSQV